MQHNKLISIGVLMILVGFGGGFLAGKAYQTSHPGTIPQSQEQQYGNRSAARGMFGGTRGTILGRDAASLTLKLSDGGSRIILLAPSTTVTKSIVGSANDLTVGTGVSVMGTPNTDGSITAQSVQIAAQKDYTR